MFLLLLASSAAGIAKQHQDSLQDVSYTCTALEAASSPFQRTQPLTMQAAATTTCPPPLCPSLLLATPSNNPRNPASYPAMHCCCYRRCCPAPSLPCCFRVVICTGTGPHVSCHFNSVFDVTAGVEAVEAAGGEHQRARQPARLLHGRSCKAVICVFAVGRVCVLLMDAADPTGGSLAM